MYLPLNREHSKKVAVAMMIIGWILIPDFMTLGTTPGADILNYVMAIPLAMMFNIPLEMAVLSTFVLGGIFLVAGFFVYPYNTKRFASGKFHLVLGFILSHPLIFAGSLILFVLIWFVMNYVYGIYQPYLEEYIRQLVANSGVIS